MYFVILVHRGRGYRRRDQGVVNGTGELVEHSDFIIIRQLGRNGGIGIRGGTLRFPGATTCYNLCRKEIEERLRKKEVVY